MSSAQEYHDEVARLLDASQDLLRHFDDLLAIEVGRCAGAWVVGARTKIGVFETHGVHEDLRAAARLCAEYLTERAQRRITRRHNETNDLVECGKAVQLLLNAGRDVT